MRIHRRHIAGCEHAKKGQGYSLCGCPFWMDWKIDGKRIRKALDTTDQRRAELRAKQIVDAGGVLQPEIGIESEHERHARSITLGVAVASYLADCKLRNLAAGTITAYGYTLTPMVEHFGKGRALTSITTAELKSFRASREIAATTNFKETVDMKAFFHWAVDSEHLTVNPADKKKFKAPRVQFEPTLAYAPEQVQAMLKVCDEIKARANEDTVYFRKRARALLLLLVYSGLRIKDATFLRRDTINFETRYLRMRTMKTGALLRIKLHADALVALKRLPALHPEYFFWDGKSRRLDCVLRYTVRRIGKLAGVPDAHPHRFRDTFAGEMLMNDVEIRNVQLALGHKSVQTTERHYGHFTAAHQELLDRATATLDFSGSKPGVPFLLDTKKRRARNA